MALHEKGERVTRVTPDGKGISERCACCGMHLMTWNPAPDDVLRDAQQREAESFPYYDQPTDDEFGSRSALSLIAGELATTL